MNYEIKGGTFPVVVCQVEAGETMNTQGGGMVWMSPNMEMTTEGGGSVGKAFGRMLSGEKIFRNNYTAKGGPGLVAFASSVPGSIVAYEVTPDHPIIAQKGAYLAATAGVQTETFFKKNLAVGLAGGEGFIMQKITGNGIVFLEIDGSAITYDLAAGQKMVIDTGNLAMMDATCTMDVETVKGAKNFFFGGEGMFHTIVTGPGKITLQTMTLAEFASKIVPFIPTQSK